MIKTLQTRFEQNMIRHKDLSWPDVQTRLEKNPQKLLILAEMEKTGGEPDVVGFDKNTGEFIFYDCSPETPRGRRSVCYDRQAHDERKTFKPKANAIDMATSMGVEILNETQYRELQKLGEFDTKTSSWIKTPLEIRKLGGALYADRRYNYAFVYHNGAQSYYASRGFRGWVSV